MALARIKEIRKKLNMTQEEFSNYLANEKKVYISRGTIAKYESGVNFPSKQTLKKLSAALNISEDYIAGRGIKKSEIDELLTDLLHNTYFNFRNIFPNFEVITDKLHTLIRQQLSVTMLLSHCNPRDIKNFDPKKFYLDKDGNIDQTAINTHFPRFKKVDDFWKKMFAFLYEDDQFKESLVGMTKEEFIEAVTHKIDYQHNKDGTKLNTEVLIDEVNGFADLVELAIYKWNNGFITKQEAINDINTKLDHINNFIPRLGFGREDKHEQ